ncbi:MAG: hypothetical protein J7K30_15090 [Deltaproteobacteria bacterium]|nr:hypothetical protein [Deltaproteobacteria bacterium]
MTINNNKMTVNVLHNFLLASSTETTSGTKRGTRLKLRVSFLFFEPPQYDFPNLPRRNGLRIPQGRRRREERIHLSKQVLEFINAQTGIPNNTSHSVGIYWVRSGNGDNSIAVGHCNVLTLPDNPKPCLLKSLHRSLMIYS